MTPEQAARIAWEDGIAARLQLSPIQRLIRQERARIWSTSRRSYEVCSRRLGKSHEKVALCDETARAKPNASIKYAASTADSVREFILPIYRDMLAAKPLNGPAIPALACPPDLAPEWKASEYAMVYPNGSRVVIVGCEDERKAGHLVGPACDLAVVDEAQNIPILDHVVESVLMPQFMTTGGRMIITGTAPKSTEHPFALYIRSAEESGRLILHTLDDATHIPAELREEFIREAGGRRSTTCRREYLCEIVSDRARAVIPEVAEAPDLFTAPDALPEHRDCYVAWDTGHVDMTVGAFGYLDWRSGRLVIEDEVALIHATVADIVQAGLDKERRLWPGRTDEAKRRTEVYRVADAPEMVLAELGIGGYPCSPPRKDREASVSNLRDLVRDRRITVHPRCATIASHLKNAVWAVNGRDMERKRPVGDMPGHHYDGVDAVRYLADCVDWTRNPTPRQYDPYTQGVLGGPQLRPQLEGPEALGWTPRLARAVRRGQR